MSAILRTRASLLVLVATSVTASTGSGQGSCPEDPCVPCAAGPGTGHVPVGNCLFPVEKCTGSGDVRWVYAPDDVTSPDPMHTLTVFLPPAGTPPADGWPVILYSASGVYVTPPADTTGARGPLEYICEGSNYDDLWTFLHPTPPFTADDAWAVVSVGTVGIDQGFGKNVFGGVDVPGWNSDWNSKSVFFGEKDFTWARQWLAENAAAFGLDNNRVVTNGVSGGSMYGAFVSLGPRREFDATWSDPQTTLDTRCAGMMGIGTPLWWDVYYGPGVSGAHWRDENFDVAVNFEDVHADWLVATSPSTWMREPNSYAADTPFFVAYAEPLPVSCCAQGSDDSFHFGPDGAPDPTPAGSLTLNMLLGELHPVWNGLMFKQTMLGVDATLHEDRSRLVVEADVDISVATTNNATVSNSVDVLYDKDNADELTSLMLEWLVTTFPPASAALRTGSNDIGFSSTDSPKIGMDWCGVFDESELNVPPDDTALIAVAILPANTPAPPLGNLLFDPNTLVAAASEPLTDGAGEVEVCLPVPYDVALVGVTLYSQGMTLRNGAIAELLHGIDLHFGY